MVWDGMQEVVDHLGIWGPATFILALLLPLRLLLKTVR